MPAQKEVRSDLNRGARIDGLIYQMQLERELNAAGSYFFEKRRRSYAPKLCNLEFLFCSVF